MAPCTVVGDVDGSTRVRTAFKAGWLTGLVGRAAELENSDILAGVGPEAECSKMVFQG